MATDSPPAKSDAEQSDPEIMDLRELEPPEPMVRVLTVLEEMKSGDTLVALLPRKPVYLLPQFDEAGHTYSLVEQEGEGWELRLTKA